MNKGIHCHCGDTFYLTPEELAKKEELNLYVACSKACKDKVTLSNEFFNGWGHKMTIKEFRNLIKPSPNLEFMS